MLRILTHIWPPHALRLMAALYEKNQMTDDIQNFEFLEKAKSLYSQSWERTHTDKNVAADAFRGSIYDIEMLNYCEYELGHPDNTYKSAALIWANVIQKNSNLNWGYSDGRYCLYTSDVAYKRFSVDVHSFLMNIVESQASQFCSFSIATEQCLLNMLGSNFSIEELSGLQSIVVAGVKEGNDCYSYNIAYAAGMIFKRSAQQLEGLHEHIDLGQAEDS